MNSDIWISLVVATFVVYRISRMIALEEGPFEVFTTIRTILYNTKYPEWIRRGIICPLCIGWWIALPIAILVTYQVHLDWYAVFWLWFALSGSASFLYKLEQ